MGELHQSVCGSHVAEEFVRVFGLLFELQASQDLPA
jgi:hypothetical protein